jgi:hypothetical protein
MNYFFGSILHSTIHKICLAQKPISNGKIKIYKQQQLISKDQWTIEN